MVSYPELKFKRVLLFVALILVISLCDAISPSDAFAWDTWGDARWAQSVIPVGVTLENVTTTTYGSPSHQLTVTKEEWQREIRAAMQLWNDAGTSFRFVEVPPAEAEVNIIMEPSNSYGQTWFADSPAGPWRKPRSGETFQYALIALSSSSQWEIKDSGFMVLSADPRTAVAHELGHVLGLNHSSDSSALMAAAGLFSKVHRWLSNDDREGLMHLYGPLVNPIPSPCTFDANTNPPDSGSQDIVGTGVAFAKQWSIKNTGTCIWGAGYQLAFVGGDQMGAPPSVNLPRTTVAPGETVDITVNMTAPSTGGDYQGNWQMRNAQGVYFGDRIYVKIRVPGGTAGGTGEVELTNLDFPSVVQPNAAFRPRVTIRVNEGQLLQSRGDMLRNTDGNLYGAWPHVAVVGTVNAGQTYTFEFYAANPITAPSSEGTYESKWRVWRNGNWAGSEITIRFDVRNGGGSRPDPPQLQSPGDWFFDRVGQVPQLCIAPRPGLSKEFSVSGNASVGSGWISADCWTPSVGAGGYEWKARVRDSSTGLMSDWSTIWHFNVAETRLTWEGGLQFSPETPSAAEKVKLGFCLQGWGGVNIGIRGIDVYAATDGTANGKLRGVGLRGSNCPGSDMNLWPEWDTLDLDDGTHLVRVVGYDPNGGTSVLERTYTLNRRRPAPPLLISPVKISSTQNIYLNTPTVTFRWDPAPYRWRTTPLRATSERLIVSSHPDFSAPILDVAVDPAATEYTATFDPGYDRLYWRVNPCNEKGCTPGDGEFHLDVQAPAAQVAALAATQYDTVFQVSWGGADDRAGIRWYDVQYRDSERGEWTDWQTHVTNQVALFTGQPGHKYYFRARALDYAGNQGVYVAGNGDTFTLVDLVARPQTPWWNVAYAGKRNIPVLNNDSRTLPAGYPVHLHLDMTTRPTAAEIYNASLTSNKGDDVRVVYNNAQELSRYVQNFTSSQIDIWFKTQVGIPTLTSDTTSYQLYYGNANAGSPPGGMYSVFPAGPDGSTVALWPFNEGAGTTTADVSGRGNNGSFVGAPTWSEGKFGKALCTDNETNRVYVPDSSSLHLSAITIEGWIRFAYHRDNWKIFDKGDKLWLDDYYSGIRYYVEDASGRGSGTETTTSFPVGQWHHFAFTYDGAGHVRMYRDGTLAYSKDNPNGISGPLIANTVALRLGGAPVCLQHLRVSNYARTDFGFGSFALITNEPSVAAGDAIAPESGKPDLAVAALTTYPRNSGSGVLVQAQVENTGTISTRNGFSVDLYANEQPTGPTYNGSIHAWVSDPMPPGAVITLTTQITDLTSLFGASAASVAPLAEVTGTLYLQVDSGGVVTEDNKEGWT